MLLFNQILIAINYLNCKSPTLILYNVTHNSQLPIFNSQFSIFNSQLSTLKNDFESSVFPAHPAIATLKAELLALGASYAAMSGSGSTVFGLFATREDLLSVPDVGEVIADSVLAYFQNQANLLEIARLQNAGLQFSLGEKAEKKSDLLEGKTIVISGNFSISRDDMKALIEAHSGKNGSSVSSKTTYLLAGTKPGPEKVKKAEELNIPIIDEATLYELIGSPADAPENSAPSGEPGDEIEPTLF